MTASEHTIVITVVATEQETANLVEAIDRLLLESPDTEAGHFWTVESDPAEVCPYDCDSCHDSDCPCDRLGCGGSGVTFDS